MENTGKISLKPLRKAFQGTHFYETHKCSIASCGDISYLIICKSIMKSGQFGQKFIYTLK
jgi:hypothetical protein